MCSIKTKFGLICVLLLTIVMIMPSASSKYVSRFMTSLTLSTKKPYFNLWYNSTTGMTTPVVESAEESGANTVSNGVVTISKANDAELVDGWYLLIAKGGNGGRGLDTVSKSYKDGGYGGIMCGVINFKPESESQSLIVYLGNSGGDAHSSISWWDNEAYKSYTYESLAGRSAFIKNTKYPGCGGIGTGFEVSGAGGGAATWVFLNSNAYVNTLMIAGGGGGTSGTQTSGGTMNSGGDGGSNIVPGSTEVDLTTGLVGRVFCGFAGTGDRGGAGGTSVGQEKADSYDGGMGYAFTTSESLYIPSGGGGAAYSQTGDFSGGGGGGYVGGQGGGTGLNGGGGASSFISDAVSTPTDTTSMTNYRNTMNFFFDRYNFDLTILDNGKIVYNNNGTPTTEIERFSFFGLYYLGTTAPTSS